MAWQALLHLDHRREGSRTVLRHRHEGPLRVFKSLYPEGDGICHNVIVHPPGGLVGGDMLDIRLDLGPQAHALLSTPGATRFYRSDHDEAVQRVHARLGPGARLEWLPLETLAYADCRARNEWHMTLEPGASVMGWDVTALAWPEHEPTVVGQAPSAGVLRQEMIWPGRWRERVCLRADDHRLRSSPLGLAGRRCLGLLWLAFAEPIPMPARETWLDAVRATLGDEEGDDALAGVTAPNPHMLVLRVLGHQAEPVAARLRRAWATLRRQAWGLEAPEPRIWHV